MNVKDLLFMFYNMNNSEIKYKSVDEPKIIYNIEPKFNIWYDSPDDNDLYRAVGRKINSYGYNYKNLDLKTGNLF